MHRPHLPEPLTGRIVVEWNAKGGEVPLFEQRVGWSAVRSFGLFVAPDSSEWIDSLQTARRLTFYPDSMGELRRPVHFDFDKVGWRPLGERCAEVLPPSPSSPAGPEFGEYVPVDELPVAIEKPQCRAAVDARGEKLAGSVVVHALVSAEGRVDRWKVVTSVPGLEEAAVACVRGYRFKPARKGGIPVAVWVAIPMRYSGK